MDRVKIIEDGGREVFAADPRQSFKGFINVAEFPPGDDIDAVRNLLDDRTIDISSSHSFSSSQTKPWISQNCC